MSDDNCASTLICERVLNERTSVRQKCVDNVTELDDLEAEVSRFLGGYFTPSVLCNNWMGLYILEAWKGACLR